MSDYPESLKHIAIDLTKHIETKWNELDDLNPDYSVSFNWDAFEHALDAVTVYQVSDFWYARFKGGCYWSGIMSAYPWESLNTEKYGYMNEDEIWRLLLQYHMEFDAHTIRFHFNPDSPINGWLRTHSKNGDVPINTSTLFETAAAAVLHLDERQRESSLWHYEPNGYCPKCDTWTWQSGNYRCPECNTELGFE